MKRLGFFDVEEQLARLSGLGDQLEAFSRTVDFEVEGSKNRWLMRLARDLRLLAI
ncbi:hypothetical protein [Gluconobacter sp. DsW_058]|uniref:hypothetical protein n=1 Tax=Gluconobacter sp. DsW_058 TaxID=1511210 RepID=UPI001302DB12|nr:hypothetical protein [Gluconobacter sp. DsW_058]